MILNTRPVEYQEQLNRTAKALGHSIVSCPVLETRLMRPGSHVFEGVDALVVTSQTAIRTAEAASRSLPVYAVGAATAAAARDAGFTDVVDGGGTAEKLLRVIDQSDFAKGLYLSARDVSRDLSLDRPDRLRRYVSYEMASAKALTPGSVQALTGGDCFVAPFYSPRSLSVFEGLVEKLGLGSQVNRATAIFIHPRLQCSKTLPWGRVVIAPQPDGDGVASVIGKAA